MNKSRNQLLQTSLAYKQVVVSLRRRFSSEYVGRSKLCLMIPHALLDHDGGAPPDALPQTLGVQLSSRWYWAGIFGAERQRNQKTKAKTADRRVPKIAALDRGAARYC